MLAVIDEALDGASFAELQQKFWHNGVSVRPHWVPANKIPSILKPVVGAAARYYDLRSCEGFEVWTHNGTRPDWHTDKDEVLSARSGVESFPICSVVLYTSVDGLSGGEFEAGGVLLTPQENKMLVFGPGLVHRVRPYEGTRCTLAINPWQIKPESFDV